MVILLLAMLSITKDHIMNINENSWHYQLVQYSTPSEFGEVRPHNLCSYVGLMLRGLFFIAVIIFFTVALLAAMLETLLVIFVSHFSSGVLPGDGTLFLAFIGMSMWILVFFATYAYLVEEKGWKPLSFHMPHLSEQTKQNSIVYNGWRAFKYKTCVLLTYKDKQ